jgi:hypothetical protein
MRIYDIDHIESELESLKEDLREVIRTNPMYYSKLSGITKQHCNYFIHNKRGMSLEKLKHLYNCIQADMNKC